MTGQRFKAYSQLAFLLIAAGTGLYVILYVWAQVLKPVLPAEPLAYSEKQIKEVEELRDVSFDPEDVPVIYREVDYSQIETASWRPRGEAPVLAELVEEGKLPPVSERVGEEPLVLEGVDGNGVYGGTWYRLENVDKGPGGQMDWRLSGTTLVRWSPLGYPIVPNVAKSWKVSDDFREWTFFLRKGMKWSDGQPFTTDDILYYWREHDEVVFPGIKPEWQMANGQRGKLEPIDSHTFKFTFETPNAFFLERLASAYQGFYAPKHYLMPYHPKYGDSELIEATMKARSIPTRRQLYLSLTLNAYEGYYNVDHPRIWPWIYRTYKASPPQDFVRNPYYWAVDTEGNQLPYLDRVHFEVVNQNLIPFAATSGEVTMQARHMRFDQYTLLMSERKKNGYEVYHWFPADRSVWTIWPNLNRVIDPQEPATRWKHQLLNEKAFRQALSLAINRQQIIDAEYHGVGEPAQTAPGYESIFHNEKLLKSYVEYDPTRANRMLDELGLTKRDHEGYRTFPDGTRMVWFMDFMQLSGQGPAQFIADDWAKVGIRAIYRERASRLYYAEKQALKHDFTILGGSTEFLALMQARSFIPVNSEAHFAIGFATWYMNGGLNGDPRATDKPGAIAPPPDHPLRRALKAYEASLRAPTREKQRDLFKEVLDIAAENVWSISIATAPPQLVVVKNGVKNVPHNAICSYSFATPANAGIETYFFENPKQEESANHQLKEEIMHATPPDNQVAAKTTQANRKSKLEELIRLLLWSLAGVSLALIGFRHPYVGKRLVIMIPTLAFISIIAFSIIQLPPGNYLDSRILALRMSGEEADLTEIAELKKIFHLEEPMVERYARWLGLYWFTSFDNRDTGLLQGNMGRSMELNRPVNEIVGDRILLTLMISLGTILLTWSIALPIGIYSAVKQYTVGDYFFTFVGFFGMCVPNFLLAIILMHLSNEFFGINPTGLFSPEYAAQPYWSWGKFVDLLKHIWVPVVVLGVGGTATMMRVMRGNLLDELKKPYVTTARAKGVRPFRLLLKYPVRLALNPFVSSIGAIFPQLVSGGAIVALVMSLPTVGPLMLQALLAEDMYLAGSMLMVLSLLGVTGTLVSDLLLLWLDPRIRMTGNAK